jgi:hypothetical protein
MVSSARGRGGWAAHAGTVVGLARGSAGMSDACSLMYIKRCICCYGGQRFWGAGFPENVIERKE